MPYASSTFNPNDGTYSFYPDDGGDPFIAAGQAAAAKHAELNPVDPYRISGKEDGYRIPGHPGLIDNYSRTQDALDDWQKDQDAYRRPASLDEPTGKRKPLQPSSELMAAAAPGQDMRTADLDLLSNVRSAAGSPPVAHQPGALPGGGSFDVPGLAMPGGVPAYLARPEVGPPKSAERGAPHGRERAGEGGEIAASKVRMAPTGPSGPNIGGIPVLGLPAAGGGKMIPGHETPAGRTEEHTIIPEADKVARKAAEGQDIESTRDLTDVEAKQAADIAGTRRDYSAKLDTFANEQRSNEALRHADMQERFAKAEQLSRDAASDPIDSGRYWKSKSAGEKAIGAIAVGLGAAGQALTRAPNVAADMLNKSITEDIEAQKANKADKREGARQQMSLFGQYREILGDERAAAAATRKDMLEAAARHVEDVVADTSSEKVKAQGNKLISDMLVHYADADAQLNAYKEHRAYKYVPAQQAGGAGAPPRFDFKPGEIVTVNGKQFAIKSGEEGAKVRERIASGSKAMDAADNFVRLAGNSANFTTPEGRALLRQAAAAMKVEAGKAGDFNARLSGESAKAVEDVTGAGDNPDALSHVITKSGVVAAVKQYRQSLQSDVQHELGSQSAIPVESRYYANPKTNTVERGYIPTGGEVAGPPHGMTQVGE